MLFRRIILPILFLSLFLSGGCFMAGLSPEEDSGLLLPSPMEGRDEASFLLSCAEELRAVERSGRAMEQIVSFVAGHPGLLQTDTASILRPGARDTLCQVWQALLDHLYTLEQIRLRQGGYWKIGSTDFPKAHAASYHLFSLSFMMQNFYGSEFTALLADNKKAQILLEEPAAGILPYSYSRLKYRVLNLLTFQTIHSLAQYGNERFKPAPLISDDTIFTWAARKRLLLEDTLLSLSVSRNLKLTGLNALDIARKQTFFLLFPLQKNLADFMGASHYSPSAREKFIKAQELDSLKKLVQPGDLILARSNWILSNTGLPGFWPHVAFYTGTFSSLNRFFETDSGARQALFETTQGKTASFSEFIGSLSNPQVSKYLDSTLNPPVDVIEALSEGSVPNTLGKTASCDYLAVLRPNLPSREKALAVLRAFQYLGKPYDFDFDFDTDAELVCSELVYKCYLPSRPAFKGIYIPLKSILGRWTLPPNDFAALFELEADQSDQQFELVAFLDADTKNRRSFFAPESVFRKTAARTKWDFLLE